MTSLEQSPVLRSSGALRALARLGLRLAYPPLRIVWFVARSRLRGVQCVIVRDDEVLLVRHTYGDRRRWELPGGAIKRDERPRDAAVREIDEELGVTVDQWELLGDISIKIDWRRGTLTLFGARVHALEPRIDEVEIEELGWFPRGALPTPRGRYVESIVALANGRL